MYGDSANKLILAAKRANTLDKIPLFETDLVQTIISESNELQALIDGINDEPPMSAMTDGTNVADLNASRAPSTLNTPLRNNRHFLSSSIPNTPNTPNTTSDTNQILNEIPGFVRHLSLARNKRCLLAYEMSRLRKIDDLVWDNVELSSEQLADLSYHERNYLEKYISLVSGVKGVMSEIDLGGSLEPPSDVFIDVRVLKDAGEIMTEYGVFNLTKDSQFFVRRVDVERLIQQGYLKQL